MSKAILVMDIPEKCGECIFDTLHPDADKTYCCGLIVDMTGELICVDNYNFTNSHRPDWCPIRPMPEKMQVCGKYPQPDRIVPSYKIGWNDCIDAIGGKANE